MCFAIIFKTKLREETRVTSQKNVTSSACLPKVTVFQKGHKDSHLLTSKNKRPPWLEEAGWQSCLAGGVGESRDGLGYPRGIWPSALTLTQEKVDLDGKWSKRQRVEGWVGVRSAGLSSVLCGAWGEGQWLFQAWDGAPREHLRQWWHLTTAPSWTCIEGWFEF